MVVVQLSPLNTYIYIHSYERSGLYFFMIHFDAVRLYLAFNKLMSKIPALIRSRYVQKGETCDVLSIHKEENANGTKIPGKSDIAKKHLCVCVCGCRDTCISKND